MSTAVTGTAALKAQAGLLLIINVDHTTLAILLLVFIVLFLVFGGVVMFVLIQV